MEIDLFVFDRSPEPLDEDVVIDPAPTVHADLDVMAFEAADKIRCCKLHPLIHVEDLRLRKDQGFFQGLYTECRLQGDRKLPGQNVTAEPVHDGHKVDKAMIHPDVRDIGTPDLVRMVDFQTPQQIGVLPVLGTGLAQSPLGINGLQAHEPHEPADPLGIDRVSLASQPECHLWDAIKRGSRKLLVDQGHQKMIVTLVLPGLIAI